MVTFKGTSGDDNYMYEYPDSGGVNAVDYTAYGYGGDDSLYFLAGGNPEFNPWVGDLPTGKVSMHGGAGNDLLWVEGYYLQTPGLTTALYGDAGADELWATRYLWEPDGSHDGGDNPDYLYGGAGDDSYYVLETKDVVVEQANQGYDTITVGWTDYTLPANVENLDTINPVVGSIADGYRLTGNALDNVIIGHWETLGSQRIDGGGGNDTISGGDNADYLYGDAGNDTIYGSQHASNSANVIGDRDTIHGGDGNDTIYGNGLIDATGATLEHVEGDSDTLYGDAGNDEMFGLYGYDEMYGGDGDDKMWGQSEADTMYGGTGNDRMGGGSGDDWIFGGTGDDTISGTGGQDWLIGDWGNDRFDYDNVSESMQGQANHDYILDFSGAGAKGGDVIDLSTIDSNSGVGGNQAFIFGGTGAGHVRAVASGADSLIQADTGGAAGPELEILVKDVAAGHWTAGDFIL